MIHGGLQEATNAIELSVSYDVRRRNIQGPAQGSAVRAGMRLDIRAAARDTDPRTDSATRMEDGMAGKLEVSIEYCNQ